MIIFLNGSINAGKSTVAKILAKKLSNTAVVEIDSLREMIDWMLIDEAVPLNLENAVSVIKNFTKKGLNTIVPYPISQDNYDYVLNELKDINTKTYFFTLAPKLEKILTNRGDRELNNKERERIKHHYDIGIQNPSFGIVVDNTNQTPEETVEEILKNIK
jgi:tRNA uridine 5-carbamoylmethylation protein Kti12